MEICTAFRADEHQIHRPLHNETVHKTCTWVKWTSVVIIKSDLALFFLVFYGQLCPSIRASHLTVIYLRCYYWHLHVIALPPELCRLLSHGLLYNRTVHSRSPWSIAVWLVGASSQSIYSLYVTTGRSISWPLYYNERTVVDTASQRAKNHISNMAGKKSSLKNCLGFATFCAVDCIVSKRCCSYYWTMIGNYPWGITICHSLWPAVTSSLLNTINGTRASQL